MDLHHVQKISQKFFAITLKIVITNFHKIRQVAEAVKAEQCFDCFSYLPNFMEICDNMTCVHTLPCNVARDRNVTKY